MRTGPRDKSQVKVKAKENFESFEDDILKKKVETQVKVKKKTSIASLGR
jgi:hypothetical protein